VDDEQGRTTSTTSTRNWRQRARCRDENPDSLFVQGAQQRDVREVCKACPVRTECLAHALDNRIRFGVWGGMTERERKALLKRRPDVVSWAGLLEAARRAAIRPQQPVAEQPQPARPVAVAQDRRAG
jgi:WhiB family transcriptional regulator, redox-sensing transcriptional regulator